MTQQNAVILSLRTLSRHLFQSVMVCVVPSGSETITGLIGGVGLLGQSTSGCFASFPARLSIHVRPALQTTSPSSIMSDAVSIIFLASLFICEPLSAAFSSSINNRQSSKIVFLESYILQLFARFPKLAGLLEEVICPWPKQSAPCLASSLTPT